jgi:plastocyanin
MRTQRTWRALRVAALLVLGLGAVRTSQVAAASPQEKPPASGEVRIDNFSFAPATVTVAAGTQVTWVNRDDIPHTVVSTANVFKSKALDTDDKFSYTFTKAGTYPYFCSLHPKMTGKVVVQ